MNILTKLKKIDELERGATPGPWYLLGNLKWNGPLGKMVGHIFSKKPKTEHHSRRCIGYFGFETSWSDALCPDNEGYNSWELPFDENQRLLIETRNAYPEMSAFIKGAVEVLKAVRQRNVWVSRDSKKHSGTDAGSNGNTCVVEIDKFLERHGLTEKGDE